MRPKSVMYLLLKFIVMLRLYSVLLYPAHTNDRQSQCHAPETAQGRSRHPYGQTHLPGA